MAKFFPSRLLLLLLLPLWVRQVPSSSVATLEDFVNSPRISPADIEALLQSYKRTKEASRRVSLGGRESGDEMQQWNSWFSSEFDLFVRCGFCTESQASYCCKTTIDKYCCKGPELCPIDDCLERTEREILAEKCTSGRGCYRLFTLPKICCLPVEIEEQTESTSELSSEKPTDSLEHSSSEEELLVNQTESTSENSGKDCSTGLCTTAPPAFHFDEEPASSALESLSTEEVAASTEPVTTASITAALMDRVTTVVLDTTTTEVSNPDVMTTEIQTTTEIPRVEASTDSEPTTGLQASTASELATSPLITATENTNSFDEAIVSSTSVRLESPATEEVPVTATEISTRLDELATTIGDLGASRSESSFEDSTSPVTSSNTEDPNFPTDFALATSTNGLFHFSVSTSEFSTEPTSTTALESMTETPTEQVATVVLDATTTEVSNPDVTITEPQANFEIPRAEASTDSEPTTGLEASTESELATLPLTTEEEDVIFNPVIV